MLSNTNKSKIYPNCRLSLNRWLKGSEKRMTLFNSINPQLFDVTLRDGLQTVPKELHHTWSLFLKKNMYYNIKFNHEPPKMELGSIVNSKIFPIFADSIQLYNIIKEESNYVPNFDTGYEKNYLLIPNVKMLKIALKNGIDNLSFITSVSDAFQMKNTNRTLGETKTELEEIINMVSVSNETSKMIKLYISCINECPISGKIENDIVLNEILYYEKYNKINELCLSDTCGTLKYEDFKYIIDMCIFYGLPTNKLSLHLHYSDDCIDNTKKIVFYALEKNINKFDVSAINGGGCTLTIGENNCHNNLTYELFYKFLVDYIETKI